MDIRFNLKHFTIKRLRKEVEESGLYKIFGKDENIGMYSDAEIKEMYVGIYRHKKVLITELNEILYLKKLLTITCELADVSYYKSNSGKLQLPENHYYLDNINTYKIKEYFATVASENGNTKEIKLAEYFRTLGLLNKNEKAEPNPYFIRNSSNKMLSFGKVDIPECLFDPIRIGINQTFYQNDSEIKNIILKSKLIIVVQKPF
jgi:hypothetical protein